jgi:glycosyltransferase involved in cell wall biosynthesis
MRILVIHNKYKQAGGEDSVFNSESALLIQHGHVVERLVFDNTTINTPFKRILSGLKTIYNPISAREIKKKILEFDPDIIHVHNFLPIVSPSVFFVAKQLHIPIVLTLHNYRLICPSATLFFNGQVDESSVHSIIPWHAIWNGVYRKSKWQTAGVVCMTAFHHWLGTWKHKVGAYIMLTQFAREKFINAAIALPPDKLFVKPNFVEDLGMGQHAREDYFLFIGRLTEEKGISTLLNAASMYRFKLVIVGDGPLKSVVEYYALHNPSISYVGFQPKEIVIDYLKRCKALIFPSTWYEGFPVTIAEAFSSGTPVIASDLGAMKEIFIDKVNGLLFDAGNERDLILQIIEITKSESLGRNISLNARDCYLKNYTPSTNYAQLTDIYERTIERNKFPFPSRMNRDLVPA